MVIDEQKMEPKVSVIMPVYNARQFLERAVESVLNQEYINFELLLVDDGSTDGSGALCDAFAKKDSRVVAVHKENGGMCQARNQAMETARGEYIAFCDDDDFMLPQCLKKAVAAAEAENADVVKFMRKQVIVVGDKCAESKAPVSDRQETIVMNSWDDYLSVVDRSSWGVWSGIYKRRLIEDLKLKFNEGVRFGYEDNIFTSRVCGHAHTVVYLQDVLYVWIVRQKFSTSRKISEDILRNRINSIKLWKASEDEIGVLLHRTERQAGERASVYLKFVASEIAKINMPEREKRQRFFEMKKDLLGREPFYLEKKKGLNWNIKFWLVKIGAIGTYGVLSDALLQFRLKNDYKLRSLE